MTDDLLPILRERYPSLLGSPHLREIGCYPGWLRLLDGLFGALQAYLSAHPEVEPVSVVRVKEKWGELRVYYQGGDKVCRGLVDDALRDSLTICEVCGDAGELVGERLFGVRCTEYIGWSPESTAREVEEGDDAG